MVEVINIQVVYALPERQEELSIKLPAGSTLKTAVEASGLIKKYPEIDPASGRCGIFSRISNPDSKLRDHDRVEIYRPLIADPKEVRRQRAAEGKTTKKGASAAARARESTNS